MKKYLFTIWSIYSLSFIACKEISPVIPPLGDKKVLIEEFTGVRCVNCPAGASEIEDLKEIYGDRLVVISIHAGDFAPPYNDSKFDFRTPEGNELEKLMGSPLGYPSAVINRKKFAGQSQLQVFRTTWAGLVANESATPSLLTLGFVKNYDAKTRKLELEVKILPTEVLNGDIKLSIALTESGVKDQQETPQGKKADYIHKYILRKMLTKFDGDALTGLQKGQTLSKNYSLTLSDKWLVENCKLVAFVHKSGTEKDVLQVNELAIDK